MNKSANIELGRRIVRIINRFHEDSKADFARSIGTSTSNVSNWVSGRARPSAAVIKSICEKYLINPHWLVEGKEPMKIDGSRGVRLVEKVDADAARYTASNYYIPSAAKLLIDRFLSPDLEEEKDYYVLIARDDAMHPEIQAGNMVIFETVREAQSGDVVIVIDEYADWMIRKYKRNDREIVLESTSPHYPILPWKDGYHIAGRVVKRWSEKRF